MQFAKHLFDERFCQENEHIIILISISYDFGRIFAFPQCQNSDNQN
jgi:hypothetical protein